MTPLLKAIGADIKYNLGPRLDKLNIVTEGITDYMYFTAMLDYLEVQEEKRPYILPSVGAGNEMCIRDRCRTCYNALTLR